MPSGIVGLVLAVLCLGVFLVYGLPADAGSLNATTNFWLGIGCGVFIAEAVRAFRGSRNQNRRSSDDALRRAQRYQDAQ